MTLKNIKHKVDDEIFFSYNEYIPSSVHNPSLQFAVHDN